MWQQEGSLNYSSCRWSDSAEGLERMKLLMHLGDAGAAAPGHMAISLVHVQLGEQACAWAHVAAARHRQLKAQLRGASPPCHTHE